MRARDLWEGWLAWSVVRHDLSPSEMPPGFDPDRHIRSGVVRALVVAQMVGESRETAARWAGARMAAVSSLIDPPEPIANLYRIMDEAAADDPTGWHPAVCLMRQNGGQP